MSARRANARSWHWRGMYFVTLGAAVAALVAGIAYATAGTGLGHGSATTGSVVLRINEPASTTCNYAKPIVPGNALTPCALSVNYTGSIPAYVSLSVTIGSTSGSGGGPLYDGTNTNGLTFTISDGQNSFTVPTAVSPGVSTACPTSLGGDHCWTLQYELAAWYSPANLTFTNSSPAVTWTVTPAFPKTAGNAYQGASATLLLTSQAVQAPAQTLPAGCTISTIGQSCPASGNFSWS